MTTTQEKRAIIAAAYSGESWANKVANMSDEQVIAVYLRFKASGKI